MDPRSLVPTKEAANLLGVSVRTVQRLAHSGTLDLVYKMPGPNGSMFFDRAHVLQLRIRWDNERPADYRRDGQLRKGEVRMP